MFTQRQRKPIDKNTMSKTPISTVILYLNQWLVTCIHYFICYSRRSSELFLEGEIYLYGNNYHIQNQRILSPYIAGESISTIILDSQYMFIVLETYYASG